MGGLEECTGRARRPSRSEQAPTQVTKECAKVSDSRTGTG